MKAQVSNRTLPLLRPTMQDMVMIQLQAGMRPESW
jgi:hypothetical protein